MKDPLKITLGFSRFSIRAIRMKCNVVIQEIIFLLITQNLEMKIFLLIVRLKYWHRYDIISGILDMGP